MQIECVLRQIAKSWSMSFLTTQSAVQVCMKHRKTVASMLAVGCGEENLEHACQTESSDCPECRRTCAEYPTDAEGGEECRERDK
jgi:hypothetical protein